MYMIITEYNYQTMGAAIQYDKINISEINKETMEIQLVFNGTVTISCAKKSKNDSGAHIGRESFFT